MATLWTRHYAPDAANAGILPAITALSTSAVIRVLPEPVEPLGGGKFREPQRTADGEQRASVRLRG